MKLSIVTTLYQSAPYIKEFYQRASSSAQELVGDDYEIVFVNDGSPDNSLSIAMDLTKENDKILVVDLSRNFGHHKALMTGLSYAEGDLVFLIDSDLEEAPEWLLDFSKRMNKEKCDVVYGVLAKRKGSITEQIFGWLYYRLFRLLTDIDQPNNITTARLMTAQYTKALLLYKERELNIGGLFLDAGFNQKTHKVIKADNSPTTYNFAHKFNHLVNAITSFSNKPLTFIFYIGFSIAIFALSLILYLVIRYLFIAIPPSGYTSIVVIVCFFFGVTMASLGIIGIYISKLFLEAKQRPYVVVRSCYGKHIKGRNP